MEFLVISRSSLPPFDQMLLPPKTNSKCFIFTMMNFNFLELCSLFILQWSHVWNLIIHSVFPSMDTEFNSSWVAVWMRISSRIGPMSCPKHAVKNLIYPRKWLIPSGSVCVLLHLCLCSFAVPHWLPLMHAPPWLFINHSNSLATVRRVREKIICFQIYSKPSDNFYSSFLFFYLYLSLSPCHSLQWSASVMPI